MFTYWSQQSAAIFGHLALRTLSSSCVISQDCLSGIWSAPKDVLTGKNNKDFPNVINLITPQWGLKQTSPIRPTHWKPLTGFKLALLIWAGNHGPKEQIKALKSRGKKQAKQDIVHAKVKKTQQKVRGLHFFGEMKKYVIPRTRLPRWLRIKNPPAMQETLIPSLDWEDTLEEGMATYSNILAWRIPWTESGALQSMGSQRVGHDWVTKQNIAQHMKFMWEFNRK